MSATERPGKLAGRLDARRTWVWVPVGEIGGGVLTVTRGKREDVYVVRREGNCFSLRNTATGARYRVGGWLGCTCPAGWFRRDCKHRRALAAVAQEGGIRL